MLWGVPFAPVDNSHLCYAKVIEVIQMRLYFSYYIYFSSS